MPKKTKKSQVKDENDNLIESSLKPLLNEDRASDGEARIRMEMAALKKRMKEKDRKLRRQRLQSAFNAIIK